MTDRFISEKDLDEAKKRRQEEWEKVRKPTDPEEVPEDEIDDRPLYDRLKEVRDRKQAEYDEEHRFRNMIRGLDSDECDFLSEVESLRAKQDFEKNKEEKALLSEIDRVQARRSVEENGPSVSDLRIKPVGGTAPKENKQAAILRMAVKRKSSRFSDIAMDECVEKRSLLSAMSNTAAFPPSCKIIDVLPGMADYASSSNSSSDSNYDSDSDSSNDLPILPVLIRSENDRNKQLSESDYDYSDCND